jgi:hypothetical protein
MMSLSEPTIPDWTDYRTVGRDRAAGDAIMELFYADGNGQGVNRIQIDIDDWIPSVQILRPEIDWNAWQIMEQCEKTMQDTQKRTNRSPQVKK